MGAIKQTIYNSELNEMAIIGLALGHPARISIIKLLKSKGVSNNKEMAEDLLLHEATISQHVKMLLNGGLIEGMYAGRYHYYKISKKYTEQIEKLFREIEFL